MKSAKIISFVAIFVFLYHTFWHVNQFTEPLFKILNESNVNVVLPVTLLKFTPAVALVLNLLWLIWVFIKSRKKQEIKHAVIISWLLLIVPFILIYSSVIFVIYNIYTLGPSS